jgi:alkylhydroperoxidase family enzyme
MSRIPLVDVQLLDPYLRSLHDGAEPEDWSTRRVSQAFATQPRLLEDYLTFYYPWHKEKGVISARLKELVRLQIATLNGCRTCAAARLSPESVDEVEARGALGEDSDALALLTEPEKIALDFAERMALDHHSITDADVRRWRDTFGDAGFIELSMMTTQYIGFGRVLAILQLETVACPI